MSKYLYTLTMILTAGVVMAGTPSHANGLGTLPQLTYTLVSDGHGGGSGRDGGSDDRSGSNRGRDGGADDRSGPNRGREAGDDHGGGHGDDDLFDDHGVDADDLFDDHGIDVNDLPDDSDVLLVPVVP